MTGNLIALLDLATELGEEKQWLFKIAKSLGVQSTMQHQAGRRGQKVAHVSLEAATSIREYVAKSRNGGNKISPPGAAVSRVGYFYLVQLNPKNAPNELKLGWGANSSSRLQDHKTVAPRAVILREWSCPRTWEAAAISYIASGCVRIGVEVFEVVAPRTLDVVIARGDAFFNFMPKP